MGKTGRFGGKFKIEPIPYYKEYTAKNFGQKILFWIRRSLIWWPRKEWRYIPDTIDPMYFITSDGRKIVPEEIITDMGTIPRPVWFFLSPFDFPRSFIIHDEAFVLHHNGLDRVSFSGCNSDLAECIRTEQIEMGGCSNELMVFIVWLAVSTFGKILWNRGNKPKVLPVYGIIDPLSKKS